MSRDTLVKAYQFLAEYEQEQLAKSSAWANMGSHASRMIRTPVAEAAYNRAVAIRLVLNELKPILQSQEAPLPAQEASGD